MDCINLPDDWDDAIDRIFVFDRDLEVRPLGLRILIFGQNEMSRTTLGTDLAFRSL